MSAVITEETPPCLIVDIHYFCSSAWLCCGTKKGNFDVVAFFGIVVLAAHTLFVPIKQ
jgi:hypothetical protein